MERSVWVFLGSHFIIISFQYEEMILFYIIRLQKSE